ncbi:lytic transglycosylase domain-containing protein [Rhodopseudomonas boonkerdii]|uniref:lytic transglycosylase domain-containing protein n=1 Tax=Rhodopseudomonas boonkerdii TaxID=475937 RepID=UPI001E3E26B4|nr:transglycosylase SLT domain-containing protein [Rhodopseudomonas boonkerdii]UGV29024.1 lytic transglycosylase domain-containing protein [Rhodopseudomonas boonkerdii]
MIGVSVPALEAGAAGTTDTSNTSQAAKDAAAKPAGGKPAAAKGATDKSAGKPAPAKSAATKPTDVKSTKPSSGGKPDAAKSSAAKPTAAKQTTTKPDASKPMAAKPAATPAKHTTGTINPAPTIQPATRQHAVAPPPAAKKPPARAAIAATSATPQADAEALENVIELVRKGKSPEAGQVVQTIGDPVARKLGEWVYLRSENNSASVERYRAFITANPSWPSQTFLRRRAEAALWDDKRDDGAIQSYFDSEKPISAKGKFALAKSLLARGDRAGAERLIRDAWRTDPISGDTENMAIDMFGALITPGDHKARMDMLLYGSDGDAGLRSAKRLGGAQMALARARLAVNKKASNAKALLDAVPSELHNDPGYLFSRIQQLRRDERFSEAARLMSAVPKDISRLHNLDEWWIERRLLSRKLLDVGEPRAAYVVARDAALPARDIYKTEQEFTAGWIALRFLKDPAAASQHFARIGVGSVNPTALARAGYWQGRAAEAAGRAQEARAAYTRAAEQSTSYYGQLARAKLGLPQLDISGSLAPRARGLERLEIVRAVQLLYALDEKDIAVPIFADVGENGDPEAALGLSELASQNKDARGMLLVGKAALNRGLPFDHYAYPTVGIPSFRQIGPNVDPAVVYAIARQESAFNPAVVSPAQAYGLMQVTPSAAQYVAKRHGATYDLARLKNDSTYNVTLGAAELGGLLEDYRGSYIMTFAGYNAGRGSVRKWIERYGDPRDSNVDAVDWVESIPFAETRNYVQRIMENLQVYRARFGGGHKLQIDADLHRGRGSSVE